METFNPFRFDGRIGRLQYLGYSILITLILFVLAAIFGGGVRAAATGTSLLASVIAFVASASYGIRRLHDFDANGWWYLLAFVPIVNVVMGLVLLFRPGTQGANRYGVRE